MYSPCYMEYEHRFYILIGHFAKCAFYWITRVLSVICLAWFSQVNNYWLTSTYSESLSLAYTMECSVTFDVTSLWQKTCGIIITRDVPDSNFKTPAGTG